MSIESRNRAFLKEYDPQLLAELEGIRQTRAQVEPARKQGLSMNLGGIWVHSKYDPLKEAAGVVSGRSASCHLHFGFGLGYFLEADQTLPHTRVLIYEPCLELMLAALQYRDLAPLLQQKQAIICCSPLRFKALLTGKIEAGEQPQILVSPFHARAFAPQLAFFQQVVQEAIFSKDLGVRSMLKHMPGLTVSALKNLPYITTFPGVETLAGSFRGRACVIVSPGPSLDMVLPDLVPYANQLVVIGMTRTAVPMGQYGIQPHFLVHNESQALHFMLDDSNNLADTCFVLAEQAEQRFFQRPSRKTFVFRNEGNQTGHWISHHFPEIRRAALATGGSVANDAFSLALLLGCNPIILAGQDLAIKGDTYYTSARWNLKFDHDPESKRLVPGYFGGQVTTLSNYLGFLLWFQDEAMRLNGPPPGPKLINATGGGARIQGFSNMKFRHALRCFSGESIDMDSVLVEAERRTLSIEPERVSHLLARSRSWIRELNMLSQRSKGLERNINRKLATGQDEIALDRLFGKLEKMKKTYARLSQDLCILTGFLQKEFLEIKQMKNRRAAERPADDRAALFYDWRTEVEVWSQTLATTTSAAQDLDQLLQDCAKRFPG